VSWIVTYVADWFESGDLPVIGDLANELGKLGLVGMHLRGHGRRSHPAPLLGLNRGRRRDA